MQQLILKEKSEVSAQNYLVQFKVQSLVNMKCHSGKLHVVVSRELCIVSVNCKRYHPDPRTNFQNWQIPATQANVLSNAPPGPLFQ